MTEEEGVETLETLSKYILCLHNIIRYNTNCIPLIFIPLYFCLKLTTFRILMLFNMLFKHDAKLYIVTTVNNRFHTLKYLFWCTIPRIQLEWNSSSYRRCSQLPPELTADAGTLSVVLEWRWQLILHVQVVQNKKK